MREKFFLLLKNLLKKLGKNQFALFHHFAQVDQRITHTTQSGVDAHFCQFRYLLDGSRWENDWAADKYIPAPCSSGK